MRSYEDLQLGHQVNFQAFDCHFHASNYKNLTEKQKIRLEIPLLWI